MCNQTLNDKHIKQNGARTQASHLPFSTGSPPSEARQSLREITNVSTKKRNEQTATSERAHHHSLQACGFLLQA